MKKYDYICTTCKKFFQHRKLDRKYCSIACHRQDKINGRKAICECCNTEFLKYSSGISMKYCSRICSAKTRGEQQTTKGTFTTECGWCKKVITKRLSQKGKEGDYCSLSCSESFKRGYSEKNVIRVCKRCNKEYEVLYRHQTEYCSRKCSSLYQSGEEHINYGKEGPTKGLKPWTYGLTKESDERIAELGAKISKTQKEQFASGVRSNAMENNPNWKNGQGVTPLHQAIRQMSKYKTWRFNVFERDKFTCTWCKDSSSDINADHIKAFSLILKENKISSIEEADNCAQLWDINNGRTLCVECHKTTNTYGGRCNTKHE